MILLRVEVVVAVSVVLGQLEVPADGLDKTNAQLCALPVARNRIAVSGRGVMPPAFAALPALRVFVDAILLYVPEQFPIVRPPITHATLSQAPS